MLDLLVASGRAELRAWTDRIASGEYDSIVLTARPTSQAELAFYREAVDHGYRVVLADDVIVELRRPVAGAPRETR